MNVAVDAKERITAYDLYDGSQLFTFKLVLATSRYYPNGIDRDRVLC